MDDASNGKSGWYDENIDLHGHYDWVGVKKGRGHTGVSFNEMLSWQGINTLYHKGGDVRSANTNTYFDNLWVTTDTLSGSRTHNGFGVPIVTNFILQVGTTDVHGEPFGNPTADKPLLLQDKSIRYGDEISSSWGVDEKKGYDTSFYIYNYGGGVIRDVTVNGGNLWNKDNGTIDSVRQYGGNFDNDGGTVKDAQLFDGGIFNRAGVIKNVEVNNGSLYNGASIEYACLVGGGMTNGWHPSPIKNTKMKPGNIDLLDVCGGVMLNYRGSIHDCRINDGKVINGKYGVISRVETSGEFVNASNTPVDIVCLYQGGTLDNGQGSIDTLYYYGGTIVAEGNIAHFIDMRGAAFGMDGTEFDEGYVDEGFDDAAVDNAGGQDAAPLGEEANVW